MKQMAKRAMIFAFSFLFAAALIVGLAINPVTRAKAETLEDGVNLATSGDNWTNSTDVKYTEEGIVTHDNFSAAYIMNTSTFLVKANSEIVVESKGNGNGTAAYYALVYKVTSEEWSFGWGVVPTGTFSVLMYGSWNGKTIVFVQDYVDGIMVKETTFDNITVVAGGPMDLPQNYEIKIKIKTEDNDFGYTADFEIYSSATQLTYTATHVSAEYKALNGDYKIGFGYLANGDGLTYTNINVTASANQPESGGPGGETEEFEPEIANLATSIKNFEIEDFNKDFRYGDNGATVSSVSSAALRVYGDVVADSKLVFDVVGKAETAANGNLYIIFKDVSAIPADIGEEDGEGTYLALRVGSDGAVLKEVKNGVPSTENLDWSTDDLAFYNGRVRIVITTKDVEGGVEVNIAFKNVTTDKEYTKEYTSDNVALHGNYVVTVGFECELAADESITFAKIGAGEITKRADRSGLVNMAEENKYWKSGLTAGAFKYRGNGMALVGVNGASMLLYTPVEMGQTLYLDYENNLTSAWGEGYYMFNADPHVASLPAVPFQQTDVVMGGDWITFTWGAMGFHVYECEGEVWKDTTVGISLDGVDQEDLNKWFSSTFSLSFEVAETDSGISITFTIKSRNSKYVYTYNSTNERLKKSLYFSLQYFVEGLSEEESNSILIKRLAISGVTEFNAPDVNVEELSSMLATRVAQQITRENYDEILADYNRAAEAAAIMNYPQTRAFETASGSANLALLKTNLDAYTENVATADEIAELIETLTAQVNKDNYDAAKAAFDAVKQKIEAAASSVVALITNMDKYYAANQAILDYENSLEGDDSSSSAEDSTSGTPSASGSEITGGTPSQGCGNCSSSMSMGSIIGFVSILAAAVVFKKKNN